jgi:hypothetical protein
MSREKKEGTVRFQFNHQEPDWATDNETYDLGIANKSGFTVQASKHFDHTIELRVSGPTGRFYFFREKYPPGDQHGLFVTITWKGSKAKLYLNGEFAAETVDLIGHAKNTRKQVVGTMGRCIYCGTANKPLTDEHIVPYALNGSWVLNQSSCRNCASITSKFEFDVLRYHFISSRTTLGLRTRRPKNRPKKFAVLTEKEGHSEAVEMPVGKYPSLIVMPIFPEPAYSVNQPFSGNYVTNYGWIQVGGYQGEELRKELGADKLTIEVALKPFSFAQLLAKIAYCVTVAEFGLGTIEEAYILPSILGNSDEIGRWVGTASGRQLASQGNVELHKLAIDVSTETREVVCRLGLFSVFGAPEYLIAVGRVTRDALSRLRSYP